MNETNEIHSIFTSETPDVNAIKCMVIKDRKYDVPEWFYDYITHDTIISLMVDYEMIRQKNPQIIKEPIHKKFKDFVQSCTTHGCIKNYKDIFIQLLEIQSGIHIPVLSLTYLFKDDIIYETGKLIVDYLHDGIFKDFFERYIQDEIYVPKTLIQLYLHYKLGKLWNFQKKEKILDILFSLYSVLPSNYIKYGFPAIHSIFPEYLEYRKIMTYEDYWLKGNTAVPNYANLDYIYTYIRLYNEDYSIDTTNQLPIIIKDILQTYDAKSDKSVKTRIKYIRMMIERSCRFNMNNLELIYWDIDSSTSAMMCNYLEDCKVPLTDFKWFVTRVFRGSGNILSRYAKIFLHRGGDPSTLSPSHVINNIEYIVGFSKPEYLKNIALTNFKVGDTGKTIIDFIIQYINVFNIQRQNIIYDVLFSDNIFKNLNIEQKCLLFKGKDIQACIKNYPNLINYFSNQMSWYEIKKLLSTDGLINYIDLGILPKNYIKRIIINKGYVDFGENVIINDYIDLSEIRDLVTTGIGLGYILDIPSITYQNSLLEIITELLN